MAGFRGLTWDHPRGRAALEAAAREWAARGLDLHWDVQPLEGFESSPIGELAARYDLLVLDHPHLGDALEHGSLLALEDVFDADELARWSASTVGQSSESYVLGGRTWALPLDAATQVSARRARLVPEEPVTWEEVRELSRDVPVALSLAGPHALLTLCSVAVAFGDDPGKADGSFLDPDAAREAFELLAVLAARRPDGSEALNPIRMLAAMTAGDRIAYCPLVYGYVNYSRPLVEDSVAFGNAPAGPSGRRGSTLGGTGIALSARLRPTEHLVDHIRWLLAERTQSTFIPAHSGQPSFRSAWRNPLVDAASAGFYAGTLPTIEQAWVRPRFPGYVRFQAAASALVREALLSAGSRGSGGGGGRDLLDDLESLYRTHHSDVPAERTPTA